jgi:hypothetical protein
MDKYYNLRYRHVIKVVETIFSHSVTGLEKQTNMFTNIDFFFPNHHYRLERNNK